MWQKFLAWLHRLSSPKSAAPALPAPTPPPKSTDPADNVPTVPATPINSGEPLWFTIARGELGQAEIPGPRNNDRIIEYQKVCVSQPNWSDSETPWCFSGDTEILTETGWSRFDELKDQKVAQVKDGKMEFVAPIRKIEKEYNDEAFLINHRSIKLICDKGHRWFGDWHDGQGQQFKTLDQIKANGLSIPKFSADDNEAPIEDAQLKFLAAFLSDGSFKWSNGKTNTKPWRIIFEVSKERKVLALAAMCPDHVYTNKKLYGKSKTPLTIFSFNFPEWILKVCPEYKQLDLDFVNSLSRRQATLFLETYSVFDGWTKNPNKFDLYTSREELRDSLTTIALRAGYTPRVYFSVSPLSGKKCWGIRIAKDRENTHFSPENIERIPFNGKMYCVEVPSSLIVVRGATKTPILTGNCSCFTSWCLEKAGIASTRNAWAQSYTNWGMDVSKNPPIGAIVVFRWSASSGHIGFFAGWRDDGRTLVRVLGGNQSDSVCYKVFGTANIVGYRWPRNIPVIGVPADPVKKPWPIKGWQPEYTQYIKDHVTSEMINSDKSKLMLNWRDYDQKQLLGWIIQAISWAECGWDRTNRYVEKGMSGDPVTKRDVTASEGLLQLSYSDTLYYNAQFDWSKDRDLADNDPNKTIFDPLLNLDAGIKIMTKLLKNDGDFVQATRRYWSTMRKEREGYAVMFKKLQELIPG